jgi:hypothetical protein
LELLGFGGERALEGRKVGFANLRSPHMAEVAVSPVPSLVGWRLIVVTLPLL